MKSQPIVNFKKEVNDLVYGSPRARYQAKEALRAATGLHEIEPELRALLDTSKNTDTQIALCSVLEKCMLPGTVAVVMRHLNNRDHLVRRAAAQALLHASPRLRSWRGQLKSLEAKEKDPQVRSVLKKLIER